MATAVRTNAQIAAQIAVEAVIDHSGDYALPDIQAVLDHAVASHVAPLYVNMLREVIQEREDSPRLTDEDSVEDVPPYVLRHREICAKRTNPFGK